MTWIQDLAQDIGYGARTLRKNPGFTAVAVVTLALGIGANTAIFSVVEAVLLRPLPFKDPSRLLVLTEYNPGKAEMTGVPFPDYIEWKNQNRVFEETAAYFHINASNDMVLGGTGSAERVQFSIVTNSFFSILGVQPARGRGFLAVEEQPGGPKVFLSSDALWRRSFGADPAAIGKAFLLDGESYTLAGVMPHGFQFPLGRDIWVPTGVLGERGIHDRISHPYRVLGRLPPGVTPKQAQAEMDRIAGQLAQTYPVTNANWRVRIRPLLDEFVGNVRTSLWVLLGAVTFILLIACTNTVNLMLARASAREQEFAIRASLGAARGRLVRQSLTESLLIVALSIIVALPLASWGLDAIVSMTSIQIPRMEPFRLSAPVLAFTALLAAVTTVLVGVAPALQFSAGSFQESLREGQRGATHGMRSRRLRNAIVVSEVALALLLLCGAGLMLKSFVQMSRVDPGFNTEHLVTMKIALPDTQYRKAEQTVAFLDRLLERLGSLPGVKAAATSTLPMSGESNWNSFNIAGRPFVDSSRAPAAEWRGISTNYFQTMGIPLLRGREFRDGDPQEASHSVIVNEAMAKQFWPGGDAIGRHLLSVTGPPRDREIIGIVANVRSFGLDTESKPEFYQPYGAWWYMNVVLRTTQNPALIIPAARREIAALDKGVPVYQVATMDQLLSRSAAPHRFNLFLLGLFAALALILAAVGIHGLLAFGVGRRRQEIGIRMALGARPENILRLIVWQGMKQVLIGVVLGVAASLVLTRFMSGLLYGVSSTDPLTFGGVAILLSLVALVACYIPARRAMRVDPMVALRAE
jgi:putative ABC transport system permease protein